MIAVPVVTGKWVRLEPLAAGHREGLRAAADDERIWQHTLVVARGAGFDAWFDDALDQRDTGRQVPFAVRRIGDDQLVGSTSFLDGRQQLRWLREAGFARTEASASYDCWTKSSDEARHTADFLASLVGNSSFARQLVAAGVADGTTLDQMREAFLRWGAGPDAFAAEAWGEVVGWRA
jgi:hypothetical protein